MRHRNDKTHLNRSKSHRKALLGNISTELFMHRRIITTLPKARYARRFAERMITFARRGSVADRRHVLRFIRNKDAVKLLFSDLGPHFKNRDGGYTRIIKIGPRRGDAAPMAILELVGFDDAVASAAPKKETKSRMKMAQKTAVEEKKDKKRKAAPKKRTVTPEPPPEPEETITAEETETEKPVDAPPKEADEDISDDSPEAESSDADTK